MRGAFKPVVHAARLVGMAGKISGGCKRLHRWYKARLRARMQVLHKPDPGVWRGLGKMRDKPQGLPVARGINRVVVVTKVTGASQFGGEKPPEFAKEPQPLFEKNGAAILWQGPQTFGPIQGFIFGRATLAQQWDGANG